MSRPVKRNSTGNIASVLLLDADGNPKTGVVYNAAGLAFYYTPLGGTPVAITLSVSNWTEKVHGWYEVDIPDAAYTGTAPIRISGVITGGVVVGDEHVIVGYDGLLVALGANTVAPATPGDVTAAQEAIIAEGFTVTVTPLTGVVESRVDGTTISIFTAETVTVAVACVDADGVAVDISAMTLQVVIEKAGTTDVSVVANDAITKSGSTFSFAVPSAVSTTEGHHRWALRKTTDGGVLMHGPFLVTYAPTVDA